MHQPERCLQWSGEMKVYTAAGWGTKFLRERRYEQARAELCRADTWLADLAASGVRSN